MSERKVRFELSGIDPTSPYLPYIRERNRNISKVIADILGLPVSGEVDLDSGNREGDYLVLASAMAKDVANNVGITTAGDFYGLIVPDVRQIDKAILHTTDETTVPTFYSRQFAERVRDLVLPGGTFFSIDEMEKYFKLYANENYNLRLKLPNQSDGNGQFLIEDASHLSLLKETVVDRQKLRDNGAVLEADVVEKKTLTAGTVFLGGRQYSFLAKQKNDKANGRDRFIGSKLLAVCGSLDELCDLVQGELRLCADLARRFLNEFGHYDPCMSRISLDCLMGSDKKGNPLVGITDITGRVGGNCPGLVLAINRLLSTNERLVTADTDLYYNPPSTDMGLSEGEKLFLDCPELRIVGKTSSAVMGSYGLLEQI